MKRNVLFTLAAASATLLVNPSFAGLTNGGFEDGLNGWTPSGPTQSAVSSPVRSGSGSLFAGFNEASGVFQTLSASPGQVWNFSGYASVSEAVLDPDFALLKIVWRDAGNNDLDVADIAIGTADLPAFPGIRSNPLVDSGTPVNDWVFLEAEGTAPANTASVSFYALAVDPDGGGSASGVYFDDLAAVPEPSALLGALTALSLGGLLLRRRRG